MEPDTVTRPRSVGFRADGAGRWTLDGAPAPALDGRYDYTADDGGFTAVLDDDRSGLVLDHPGTARRSASPGGIS